MLRIDLTRADAETVELDERIRPAADSGGEDVVSPGEVHLRATLERGERGYVLHGTAAGKAVLRCVRCLGEFEFPFEEAFEVRLLPVAAAPQEEDTRLASQDLDVRFFEEPWLDLTEVAGEQLGLAVPMKPLCSESCRGLCPRCGADLNRGRCACPPNRDERWQGLLEFRARRSGI